MRPTLAATLLCLLPAVLAQPAAAQSKRLSVFLTLMGEPFIARDGHSPVAAWMAGADTDRSGSISLAELAADADRFFKTLDVDSDGRIGGDEMTRYEQKVAPATVRVAGGMRPLEVARTRESSQPSESSPGGEAGRGGTGSIRPDVNRYSADHPAGIASIPQPVAMTDADLSGFVTVEEFTRAATRRFATADSNKNGLLETSELTGRR